MIEEQTLEVKKTISFSAVSAILVAVVFLSFHFSESYAKDAVFGAVVGTISAIAVCLVIGTLEPELMPEQAVRHSATGTIGNVVIGAYVGLIVMSILVTVFVPIMALVTRPPSLFLWGALLAALVGWLLGAILGAAIGASWSRWRRA
ncbi:MAG: hypothetical protein AMJ56_11640 [Anaerolineae bacterium SG8_19]|jgi:membrane associated rhomboid family serine protease|nr:MAG: hypothetical protein AMJ56_11640 [Anaerolineae bacterium SG8_19]